MKEYIIIVRAQWYLLPHYVHASKLYLTNYTNYSLLASA